MVITQLELSAALTEIQLSASWSWDGLDELTPQGYPQC